MRPKQRPEPAFDDYGVPRELRVVGQPFGLTLSPVNRERLEALQAAFEGMLREALTRGWYGTLSLEVEVLDGTLQAESVERVRRRR